jgi:hypothetical protein
MVGSDTNADQLQLANRIDSAVICTNILAEHPDWERGPRRLRLSAWQEVAGDVSANIDHIGPGSWKGDVHVKNIVLMTSWKNGR